MVGAPGYSGGGHNWAGFEAGLTRLFEGGASAGNGAGHLPLGMGGVNVAVTVSLFSLLMFVFLCIFSFGASDFYSFLYQKCMTLISFSLNRTFKF